MTVTALSQVKKLLFRQPVLQLAEDEVQSQTIYFLRFVLIAAVAFSHAYLISPWEPYQGHYSLFTYIFIRISLFPLWFFGTDIW